MIGLLRIDSALPRSSQFGRAAKEPILRTSNMNKADCFRAFLSLRPFLSLRL